MSGNEHRVIQAAGTLRLCATPSLPLPISGVVPEAQGDSLQVEYGLNFRAVPSVNMIPLCVPCKCLAISVLFDLMLTPPWTIYTVPTCTFYRGDTTGGVSRHTISSAIALVWHPHETEVVPYLQASPTPGAQAVPLGTYISTQGTIADNLKSGPEQQPRRDLVRTGL